MRRVARGVGDGDLAGESHTERGTLNEIVSCFVQFVWLHVFAFSEQIWGGACAGVAQGCGGGCSVTQGIGLLLRGAGACTG